MLAAMTGIVAMLPELADRPDREGNTGLRSVAHDIAHGWIVLPVAVDQWLRLTAATWPFRAQPAPGIAYAVAATLALYLNLFVLIVQSFQKVLALQPLAPT